MSSDALRGYNIQILSYLLESVFFYNSKSRNPRRRFQCSGASNIPFRRACNPAYLLAKSARDRWPLRMLILISGSVPMESFGHKSSMSVDEKKGR